MPQPPSDDHFLFHLMPTPLPSPTCRLFVFVVVFTAFSFILSSSNVSSAAPYTSASSSSSPPTVESAHFSTRRATIVGRYGGTVVGEVYQFLDVNFSEPMYARVDNLLCPASADASTGRASPRCAAASSDGGASCGNFTSSSSCLNSSNHTCLVAGQGSSPPPTNPSCTSFNHFYLLFSLF